jgi:hypothetical protein
LQKLVRQLLGFFYIGTGLYKFRNIFQYTERIKQKSTLEEIEINAQARRHRKYPKFFWTECTLYNQLKVGDVGVGVQLC